MLPIASITIPWIWCCLSHKTLRPIPLARSASSRIGYSCPLAKPTTFRKILLNSNGLVALVRARPSISDTARIHPPSFYDLNPKEAAVFGWSRRVIAESGLQYIASKVYVELKKESCDGLLAIASICPCPE